MSEPAVESSTPEEGPASIREALEESFRELQAEPTTEPESTESAPTDDDAEPAASDKLEAVSDPSEDVSQGDEEVILAPEHWSAEDRELFDELPSAAQQSWLRREKEYEQGIQKKADELKPLYEAFGHYRDILKMRGIDEATAIRTWVGAQAALDTNPVNGLKLLIHQYGPDVHKALGYDIGQDMPADDGYGDPEVMRLRQELDQVKRQNRQSEAQFQSVREQEALQQVRQFREEADASGNPVHPHFDEVQEEMRALLMAGVAPDLQSAYDKAVWSLPAYRDQYAEQQRKSAEVEATKRREAAAKRAKRTGKSVNGKSSVPPPPSKAATLRDDLLDAWKQSTRGEL